MAFVDSRVAETELRFTSTARGNELVFAVSTGERLVKVNWNGNGERRRSQVLAISIKVGRLMDRSVVRKLLRAVSPEDLEGLKSICVRTVPHRSTKKRERRWGGIHGQHGGRGEGTSRIWIYLWGITQGILKKFRYGHSNLYDSFIEEFAGVLYHEVGHHVHSKTAEYKALHAQLKTMRALYALFWLSIFQRLKLEGFRLGILLKVA